MKAKILLAILPLAAIFSCQKMNDLHDKYLVNGEDIYICKPTECVAQAGYEKIKITYKYSDVRTGKISVTWRGGSILEDVPENSLGEECVLMLEDLPEDTYTLSVKMWSADETFYSVPIELQVTTFGEYYVSGLQNAKVLAAYYLEEDQALFLNWRPSFGSTSCEIYYTDCDGKDQVVPLPSDATFTNIPNIDINKSVSYCSYFHPASSFEEFSTTKNEIKVESLRASSVGGYADKSRFARWNPEWLPYADDYEGRWKIENLWDGFSSEPGFAALGADEFTFDTGQLIKAGEIVFHQRANRRYLYCGSHPKTFSVYGSISGQVGQSLGSWGLVGHFVSSDPGHETGYQNCATEDDLAALNEAGEKFVLEDSSVPFRYLRFVCESRWAIDGADLMFTEIDIKGSTYAID